MNTNIKTKSVKLGNVLLENAEEDCSHLARDAFSDEKLEVFQGIIQKKLSNLLGDCDENHNFDTIRKKSIETPNQDNSQTDCASIHLSSDQDIYNDQSSDVYIYQCSDYNSDEAVLNDKNRRCNKEFEGACPKTSLSLPNCKFLDSYCNCITTKVEKKTVQPKECKEEPCDNNLAKEDVEEAPTIPKHIEEVHIIKKNEKLNSVIGNRFVGSFLTGSAYRGDWNIEMSGFGKYQFSDGSEYHGNFKKGNFHGKGILITPAKFRIEGTFNDGVCKSYKLFFPDGLEYQPTNWKYCKYPDRRYWAEITGGVLPVGDSYLTPDKIPKDIPEGCYDLLDGLLHEETGFLLDPNEPHDRIKYILKKDRKWILENCRKNKREYIGVCKKILEMNNIAVRNTNYYTSMDANPLDVKSVDSQSNQHHRSPTPPNFPKL